MNKKTVHIIYSGLGGHFDYVFNLIDAMEANQRAHILFFGVEPVPGYYQQKCAAHGIPFSTVLKTGYGINATRKILKILGIQRPDLIYVHSNAAVLPAYLYKLLRRTKLVLIEHHNNQLKTPKDHKRSRYAQTRFDRVVFLTQTHLNEAKKTMRAVFNENKSVVIQTGIPAVYFNEPRVQQSTNCIIGMQSRLVPIKDHETLITAFKGVLKRIPGARLKIAGEGVEQGRLEKLAANLGIKDHVDFEGMLSKQELITWLGKLTIYVHATLGETSSIALMEALAQGLPVIASDVTGVNDFLIPDAGILVPARNTALLEQAISGLWNDEKKRSCLSENAFNFAVTNCSLKKMATSYQQLEQDILK